MCLSALCRLNRLAYGHRISSVCVNPSWQKDFGAKELHNVGGGRGINAPVFPLKNFMVSAVADFNTQQQVIGKLYSFVTAFYCMLL